MLVKAAIRLDVSLCSFEFCANDPLDGFLLSASLSYFINLSVRYGDFFEPQGSFYIYGE